MTTLTADQIDQLFSGMPDQRQALDTAQVYTATIYIDGKPVQRECVTVTLFDKRAVAGQEAQP